MAESSERQSEGPKLPFKLRNPDGSYQQVADPVKQSSVDQVLMLNPDEVRSWKGMGYTPEQVEPEPKPSFIEESQTRHDKDED